MLSFAHPEFLFALTLIPLLYRFRSTQTIALDKRVILTSRRYSKHLLSLAIVLAIFALANPIYKTETTEAEIETQDIILALDLSRSMRLDDLTPNRFEFAKAKAKAFIERVDARFTILAFTSNAMVLSPPTMDKELLITALDSIEIANITTKSTKIDTVFELINHLAMEKKQLIIFSDGGDDAPYPTGDIKTAILACATNEGGSVTDEEGNALFDSNGKMAISRANTRLKEGYEYYAHDEFEKLVGAFDDSARNLKLKAPTYTEQSLRDYFLSGALLFFVGAL